MNNNSINAQIEEFIKYKTPFKIIKTTENYITIEGVYYYKLSKSNYIIHNAKSLNIKIPKDFPISLPIINLNGCYPKDFSHRLLNGAFCLAAPSEINFFLLNNPSLKEYFVRFLEPFLFTLDWYTKFNNYPFGEREHDNKGRYIEYINKWNLKDYQFKKLAKSVTQKHYKSPSKYLVTSGIDNIIQNKSTFFDIMNNNVTKQRFINDCESFLKGGNEIK